MMHLYSTKNRQQIVSLKEAVFKGLPEDNGLFMPVEIPLLNSGFIQYLKHYSFQEIGFTIARALFQGEIPEKDLWNIIERSVDFPAPLVKLDDQKYVLELFHGPSLAFKDFGARFMAGLMGYFNEGEKEPLTILVATSGDTGGAVAAGFYRTPGIRVVILYPSGKVSDLQEKQLTTLGENIFALEVEGTFDDCQAMVKQAFLDHDLRRVHRLSSANSINISRLVPQSFYYFEAFKHLENPRNLPVVFSIPSGNFGNLTAGLFAQKMGLPIYHFIAATNINDIVPTYLKTGKYHPAPSHRTLSNAMDVGDPSNFARMVDLFQPIPAGNSPEQSAWNQMKTSITGFSVDDSATRNVMTEVFNQYNYILDPHGAVGYLALKKYQENIPFSTKGIILETAHPAKFLDEVTSTIHHPVEIPERLAALAHLPKQAWKVQNKYSELKTWLLENT